MDIARAIERTFYVPRTPEYYKYEHTFQINEFYFRVTVPLRQQRVTIRMTSSPASSIDNAIEYGGNK